MAQTAQEIYNTLILRKNTEPLLASINTDSQTAINNLIYYIIAVQLSIQQQYFDVHKQEIQNMLDNQVIATALWWNYIMKKFQYDPGVEATSILKMGEDYVWRYETIDETKQIIKYASCFVQGDSVAVKVAKQVNNAPAQLSSDELAAAYSYAERIQTAGIYLSVNSFAPDTLRFTLSIFYDGNYVLSEIKENVRTAIKNYLLNLNFAGKVEMTKLIDYIQQVQGVMNVSLKEAFLKPAERSSETELNYDNGHSSNTEAGYATWDEAFSLIEYKKY